MQKNQDNIKMLPLSFYAENIKMLPLSFYADTVESNIMNKII